MSETLTEKHVELANLAAGKLRSLGYDGGGEAVEAVLAELTRLREVNEALRRSRKHMASWIDAARNGTYHYFQETTIRRLLDCALQTYNGDAVPDLLKGEKV